MPNRSQTLQINGRRIRIQHNLNRVIPRTNRHTQQTRTRSSNIRITIRLLRSLQTNSQLIHNNIIQVPRLISRMHIQHLIHSTLNMISMRLKITTTSIETNRRSFNTRHLRVRSLLTTRLIKRRRSRPMTLLLHSRHRHSTNITNNTLSRHITKPSLPNTLNTLSRHRPSTILSQTTKIRTLRLRMRLTKANIRILNLSRQHTTSRFRRILISHRQITPTSHRKGTGI